MTTDSPDVVIAKQLLDHVKAQGFQFQRVAEGPDGALLGIRRADEWTDTVYLDGFSRGCYAMRERATSLVVPGGALVEHGSWCELSSSSDGGIREVWEGGPRRLWASIEAGIEFWRQQGEPGWERFGLTVAPGRQTVWLDTPGSHHQWPISVLRRQ